MSGERGEFEELERLRALFQAEPPPEPDEAAWGAALARLHESLPPPSAAARGRRWRRRAVLASATAAAVLAAVLLLRPLLPPTSRPQERPDHAEPTREQPYPVAAAEDVTILSMDAQDVAALVVGEPPVGGDWEFARSEDVRVIRCERCPVSGAVARFEPGGEVPMFVTSVAAAEPPGGR